MVLDAEQISQIITDWWNKVNPDARSKAEDIESGLRALSGGDAQHITVACQYWIKGLPSVCGNWKNGVCAVSDATGFNGGVCDGLGRNNLCSKYNSKSEDLNQYVCVLPCLSKSGFGKQVESVTDYVYLRSYKSDEIKGYNKKEGSEGVGQCDGLGMGRGKPGFGLSIAEIYKLRPVCRHYRPWSMGFGAVVPRPLPEVLPTTLAELHDGLDSDPLTPVRRILPFAFNIYNQRAFYQKCVHWDALGGSSFMYDEHGGIVLEVDPSDSCKCKSAGAEPYKTITKDWPVNVPYILINSWAEYGGIVCNGAKPECPCYTGEWLYCIDDKMRDGMRITAEQLLELRFWTSNWADQDEYDAYYKRKPGPTAGNSADETTSDIYTFTDWDRLDPLDPSNSIMNGMKHRLCVPVPLNNKKFDVAVYVEKEKVKYPKLKAITGTNAPGDVVFPTIVQSLDSGGMGEFPPYIEIIYPYSKRDPWDKGESPCEKSSDDDDICIHASNKAVLPGPDVSVIGYSMPNKIMYVINTNSRPSDRLLKKLLTLKHISNVKLSEKDKIKLYSEITKLIEELQETNVGVATSYFDSITSDSDGFFAFGKVGLEYGKTNTLLVICKYSENPIKYCFKSRKVISRFYGGYISQTEFTHDIGSGDQNYAPTVFKPAPTLSADIILINGTAITAFSVYSLFWAGILEEYVFMSYCINEYTEEAVVILKWTNVGPTTYIFAEIDNIDLSYIFDFKVIEAYLFYEAPEEDKTKLCEDKKQISLKQVEDLGVDKHNIPPNAVILKPTDALGLRKGGSLSISYKYQKLETFMASSEDGSAKVAWPEGMTAKGAGYYRFVDSPYSVAFEKNKITVNGTRAGTYAVMAYIVDEQKRVQAATATKLLTCVNYSGCRNVDIFYKYEADATAYQLQPNAGLLTWRGADILFGVSGQKKTLLKGLVGDNSSVGGSSKRVHKMIPLCGDHDCTPGSCIGPMWYPFDTCTDIMFYNVFNGAGQCTSPITEGRPTTNTPAGWRYCQAPQYIAWVAVTASNWASACGSSFRYYYSKITGENRFTGKAKIRGSRCPGAPPPFGVTGREYTERWLSKDFASFIDRSVNPAMTRAEYMPHIIDNSDLFMDFNCFSRPNLSSQVGEPFSYISQLNLFRATWVNEAAAAGRLRFEELFEIIKQSGCSYPPPLYDSGIKRYGFKMENTCWAWQEWWKDIERRSTVKSESLNVVNLAKPEYVFDYDKKEHRLITDEGKHIISIMPSGKKEEGGSGSKYPGISLDGAYPRLFRIVYKDDEYSASESVEWMDENTIYEKATMPEDDVYADDVYAGGGGVPILVGSTKWAHDYNTLFDKASSAGPSSDRKIVVSEDDEDSKYFNRGLIVNLPKNRLVYLPMNITPRTMLPIHSAPTKPYYDLETYPLGLAWTYMLKTNSGHLGVPVKVVIKGQWGIKGYRTKDELRFCFPTVRVFEPEESGSHLMFMKRIDEVEIAKKVGKFAFDSYTEGKYGKLYDYEITIELSKLPTHMVSQPPFFQVALSIMLDEFLIVKSVEGFTAKYKKGEETIQVWERRYQHSTLLSGDNTVNPDGPKTDKYRSPSPNSKTNGQYFPLTTDVVPNAIKLADKMTMVGAGKYSPDPPEETVTKMGESGGTYGGGGSSYSGSAGDGIGPWLSWDEASGVNTGGTGGFEESGVFSVTISNLKTVERDKQKKLYEAAQDKDKLDILKLTPFLPPGFDTFITKVESTSKSKELTIKSNKLLWINHHLVKRFRQDGLDFFTPGGHYFSWLAETFKTRCTLFGAVENVYIVAFMHPKHGKSIIGATAGEAYKGWVSLAYMLGRLDQIAGTGAGLPKGVDLLTRSKIL